MSISKLNHSTGPWIVEAATSGFSGNNWLVCSCGLSSEDNMDYYVTTDRIHASEFSGDAKYDAQLIAAAPAMLEALESVTGFVRDCYNVYRNDSAKWMMDQPSFVKAEQAIRKARGEE